MSDLTDLISSCRAGDMTLDGLGQRFRARQWPVARRPEPESYLELAARAQEDPREAIPDSSDDVQSACARGHLTLQEYGQLAQAVQEARRAAEP